MNELAIQQEPQVSITPMQIIDRAYQSGASIEQLTQLLALQERYEANEARKAFNVAFSAFKAEAITIVRNIEIKDGPLKGKKHADLYGVVSAVTPAMSKHGISHNWKLSKDEPGWMEVTCTIRHVLGYSESAAMGSGPDTGPGRNAIQARGSAKRYLERYTLLALIGMSEMGQDDDGRAAGATQGMEPDEIDRWLSLIESAPDHDKCRGLYKAAFADAELAKDDQAKKRFIAAKDKRRAELA